jgi:DNA-directed RNA polymerase specialized sigma24 family protein
MPRDQKGFTSPAWEQELVAGMRSDDPNAYMDFFRCYRPLLLGEARRLRIQPALCDEIVDECLDDVAMRLRRHTTPVPRSLAPYLIRALRLHYLAQRRGDRRRSSDERDAAASDAMPSEAAVLTTVSEATIRASAGDYVERQAGSTALERLASMVEEGLSDEEELIRCWVSRWVPQRLVAEWLGISHGAARNRVMRLRARLKEIAMQHVASFPDRERLELDEFFRRTFATTRRADGSRADGGQRARPAQGSPTTMTQAETTDDA